MSFFLFLLLATLLSATLASSGSSQGYDHSQDRILRYQLRRRHNLLKQLALTALKAPSSPKSFSVSSSSVRLKDSLRSCPKDRLLITEFAFGRSGNNLIEFTHGLWLAKRLNATLIVPDWMKEIFIPFDLSFIESIYCFSLDSSGGGGGNGEGKVYEMTSENSFFPFQLKKEFQYPEFIPEILQHAYHEPFTPPSLSGDASMDYFQFDPFIQDLSKHFLQVYSSLWCCPSKKLMILMDFFLIHFMKGSLSYSAVHKRQLEGGCSKILSQVTKPSDYPIHEIPSYHNAWSYPLHRYHPICEMSPSFIQETLHLNHRCQNLSNVFIAFDGHGGIAEYEKEQVIFSHYLLNIHSAIASSSSSLSSANHHSHHSHHHQQPQQQQQQQPTAVPISNIPERFQNVSSYWLHKLQTNFDQKTIKELLKYLDMLLAIHSEFFILNPRSTFSFQIFVIRVCLGLQSVPVIRDNDFYMQKIPDEWKANNRSIWVSWTSVIQAAAELL